MDKNNLLIKLSETGRFWKVDFDKLTHPEKVFYAIWELEGDVNNGGFYQYYSNESGNIAFIVVDALIEIGASKTANIVSRANSVFKDSYPPANRSERQAQLDKLSEEQLNLLEDIDKEFFMYPDNLTELLYNFVSKNIELIDGAHIISI